MSNYKIEKIKEIITGKNKKKKTQNKIIQLKITKNNKKDLNMDDIQTLNDRFSAKLNLKGKFYIRAFGIGEPYTLKGYDNDLMLDEEIDDYLQGKIQINSMEKYKEFNQIHIGIMMEQEI